MVVLDAVGACDATRVPSGFVPVPLLVGGAVRPHLLLPNKTERADQDWIDMGPVLAPLGV